MRLLPRPDPYRRYTRAPSSRVLAAIFDVIVGVRLLLPDVVLDNPSYHLVRAHFHGDLRLGLVLLVAGGLMTMALYTDRWGLAVWIATWWALLTWLTVAVDIAITVGVSQLGTLAYALVAALHGFAFYHGLTWYRQRRRDEQARALLHRPEATS